MKTEPNWREMGLTSETLYDWEYAKFFWLQYKPGPFIQAIVHDMREQLMSINTLVKFISENPTASSMPQGDGLSDKLLEPNQLRTVRDGCETILKLGDRLGNMLTIAIEYGRIQTTEDKT